jgi:pyruvate,water dikinase
LDYPNIDTDLKKAVESVARGHASPRAFYVDKVAEGVGDDRGGVLARGR